MAHDTAPLLPGPVESEESVSGTTKCKQALYGILFGLLKGLESMLDWSPFIVVSSLGTDNAPAWVFAAGTAAAAFVLLYSFLKGKYARWSAERAGTPERFMPRAIFPKSLDLGQFVLFGLLWMVTCGISLLEDNTRSTGKSSADDHSTLSDLLVLWFNSITTAGMGLIMWWSVFIGKRPFVFDYVEGTMPPFVWNKLIERQWFRDFLTEAALLWVRILAAMTAIVSIYPFIVSCIFIFGQDPSDGANSSTLRDTIRSAPQWLVTVRDVMNVGQFVIVGYGVWRSAEDATQPEKMKSRVRAVQAKGLSEAEQKLYTQYDFISPSKITGGSAAVTNVDDKVKVRIKTLMTDAEMRGASDVVLRGFEEVNGFEMLDGFMDTPEERLNFLLANLHSIKYFGLVLGAFESSGEASGGPVGYALQGTTSETPRCVMVCIPAFSKSQEEVKVFNSYHAWEVHGLRGTSPTATSAATDITASNPGGDHQGVPDFKLPNDAVMLLGNMKEKRKHKLYNRPYIYVAYFAADPELGKGKGYGRSLMQFVIQLSEEKNVPLVLETTTADNISHYERCGFVVVDRLDTPNDFVLMVREAGVALP